MAVSDTEYDEGVGGLEDNDKYPDQGLGEATGVRIFLQRLCPVGVYLCFRDVGGYYPHGTGPGGLPIPGGTATVRADATKEVGWWMGVHLDGGGDIGGGVRSNGKIHLTKAEYSCAVYFNATNYVPVRGVGEESGGTGRDAVVVKIGT